MYNVTKSICNRWTRRRRRKMTEREEVRVFLYSYEKLSDMVVKLVHWTDTGDRRWLSTPIPRAGIPGDFVKRKLIISMHPEWSARSNLRKSRKGLLFQFHGRSDFILADLIFVTEHSLTTWLRVVSYIQSDLFSFNRHFHRHYHKCDMNILFCGDIARRRGISRKEENFCRSIRNRII